MKRQPLFAINSIIVLLTCIACSESTPEVTNPDPKPAPKVIRIATWNVQRLFDDVCDSNACGGSNFEPLVTKESFQTKLKRVAQGILYINADVILLQEIEKESTLKALQNELGAENYPGFAFAETGYSASMDIGILSRATLTNITTHRDKHWIEQPDGSVKRLSRELLQADITFSTGEEVTVLTTHFVSKATDAVGDRRLGEAVLTQQILAEYIAQNPERMLVFGGDLNDEPTSPSITALVKDDLLSHTAQTSNPNPTWDRVTLDYLFYPTTQTSKITNTHVICDANASGFSSSDHCAVRIDIQ